MKSFFVTGTDTNVGKTFITAGMASFLFSKKVRIGVMKPFASGVPSDSKFKSDDVQILMNAANLNEDIGLINPQFFPIPASPFTASLTLGMDIQLNSVFQSYSILRKRYDCLLVEGIGGILTPILKKYFIADLIKDMNIPTIIICTTKIGTINHTLMTIKVCENFNLDVAGIIINDCVDGYPINDLKRDLNQLCNVPILGIIPKLSDNNLFQISQIIGKEIDMKSLFDF